jgi:hypothetical protein
MNYVRPVPKIDEDDDFIISAILCIPGALNYNDPLYTRTVLTQFVILDSLFRLRILQGPNSISHRKKY